MNTGWYLAVGNKLCGDKVLANVARIVWLKNMPDSAEEVGPGDGVSIYVQKSCPVVVVLIRNGKFIHLPPIESIKAFY